jgi:hypothetical protein
MSQQDAPVRWGCDELSPAGRTHRFTLEHPMSDTGVYGTLHNYRTGEAIRPATADERAASLSAGPTGAFEAEVDGETVVCFVG